MYSTVLQLINAFGAVETARVCDGDSAPFLVTAELFTAAAKGESLEGASEEEIAATAAAIERAQSALRRATQRMDSYLGQAVELPLAAEVIEANSIEDVCLNFTRYILNDNRATEEIRSRYKDDESWLKSIANGSAKLIGIGGGTLPSVQTSARRGQVRSSIDWERYP